MTDSATTSAYAIARFCRALWWTRTVGPSVVECYLPLDGIPVRPRTPVMGAARARQAGLVGTSGILGIAIKANGRGA